MGSNDDDRGDEAMTMAMTIERDELVGRLEAGVPIRLVLALGRAAFDAAHIPGSVTLEQLATVMPSLDRDDEIVVYCSHWACSASRHASRTLEAAGFRRVRRYAGGLSDWADAGLLLEGSGRLGAPETAALVA
jgi:rhodanese-related sulfurtransferase